MHSTVSNAFFISILIAKLPPKVFLSSKLISSNATIMQYYMGCQRQSLFAGGNHFRCYEGNISRDFFDNLIENWPELWA